MDANLFQYNAKEKLTKQKNDKREEAIKKNEEIKKYRERRKLLKKENRKSIDKNGMNRETSDE